MSLGVGQATSGKTGALALRPGNTGSPIYIPVGSFNVRDQINQAVVDLINNTAFSSNSVQGISWADLDIGMPFVAALHTAAFYASILGYVAGDTDGTNYSTLTMYPDNAGSAPSTYGYTKFGTLSQTIQFSTSGLGSAIGQRLTGRSLDPESTVVTALAPPSAGPLSNSGVVGYQQTTLTTGGNPLDGLAQVKVDVNIGLTITPGKQAGNNARFPYLAKGALATALSGRVSITQVRNAQYVLNSNGILVMDMGSTGAGVAQSMSLMPITIGLPSGLGVNMMQSTYALKSIAGESPISWQNL